MSPSSESTLVTFVAALGSLLAGSCAVGPDFKQPAAPDADAYAVSPVATAGTAGVAGGEPQRFMRGGDIAADWWTLFHSPPLNELIEHSLTNNPDLKAAQAALAAAREGVLAQRGAYYPSVSGSFSASSGRMRSSFWAWSRTMMLPLAPRRLIT